MIKNKIILEYKIDDRIYQMMMDSNAPLGEIFDVLCQMKSLIVSKINEIDQLSIKNDGKLNEKLDSESSTEI